MLFKNRMDMHTHSDNSPDGNNGITYMCETALDRGLRAIAITDHCECNEYEKYRYGKSIRQSYFETVKARSAFSAQLVVTAGMELGQPTQNPAAADEAIRSCKFDFILGSLHNVAGSPDFYYMDYSLPEYNPHKLLKKYFSEMLEMVKTVDFDALTHMTYPARYITGLHGIPIDFNEYADQIGEILELLVKKGRALEINVSEMRREYKKTLPPLEIVQLYHNLGGKYITVGSDAHHANDIGADLETGMAVALEAGFKHTALYINREPILIEIK